VYIFKYAQYIDKYRAISMDFNNVKPPFEIIDAAKICEHYFREIGI